MEMKDDHDFHVAMSVMSWYDTPTIPLNIEEQWWRDTHTKRETIKVAMRYAPSGSVARLKKTRINKQLETLRIYAMRHPQINKTLLRKVKRCLESGAKWHQIEGATHHGRSTLYKHLKEGV